ncbi:MAG: iron ABC transporter permease, partial [Rhodospirillaceae bacterium]|nr:iron ABC transporter permease [Rhodospirillaceae bacterium]
MNASPGTVSAPPLRPARAVWGLGLAAVLGAVLLPIAVVLAHLFVPTGDLWTHLSSTVLPRYVVNTLWLIAGVGVLTLIGGVGTAWLVSLCRFPGRRFFSWALLLPFAMPAYVIAYTYTGLLDFAGPVQSGLRDLFGWSAGDYPAPNIRSLAGAIVMLSLVLYPYVYLLSRSAFLEQSICSLEVSRTLGCTPAQAMWRVALPLARPSIVAGMALALLEALNEFGAMQHFGVDTFTTGIFRVWLADGSPAAAAKLASVFLIFVFAILVLERRSRGRAAFHNLSIRYRPLPGWRLAGWRAAF